MEWNPYNRPRLIKGQISEDLLDQNPMIRAAVEYFRTTDAYTLFWLIDRINAELTRRKLQ